MGGEVIFMALYILLVILHTKQTGGHENNFTAHGYRSISTRRRRTTSWSYPSATVRPTTQAWHGHGSVAASLCFRRKLFNGGSALRC
jgi:hypothetical protein